LYTPQVRGRRALKTSDTKLHLVKSGSRICGLAQIETDQVISDIGEAYSCEPDPVIAAVVQDCSGRG
jgi:hypothetical protein